MTREEAILDFQRAFFPNGTEFSARDDRNYAIRQVDAFVALGLLKLDEPENADERATLKAIAALDKRGWSRGFFSVLDDAGLKIIEK